MRDLCIHLKEGRRETLCHNEPFSRNHEKLFELDVFLNDLIHGNYDCEETTRENRDEQDARE